MSADGESGMSMPTRIDALHFTDTAGIDWRVREEVVRMERRGADAGSAIVFVHRLRFDSMLGGRYWEPAPVDWADLPARALEGLCHRATDARWMDASGSAA